VEDLDGEVLALLTEHLPHFLLEDLAGPVVRVHHVVAALELDVLRRDKLEVVCEVRFSCVRNGGPP
jgi:hypothetical protein